MAAQRSPTPRQWLDVAFSEKEQAKALGARWDPAQKRWFAGPRAEPELLERWAARPEVPELLPGEDRTFGTGLFVDLVPQTGFFSNVRSAVAAGDWERLRRMILGRAGRRCEVCGRGEDRAVSRWLEAHERWEFDDRAGVQALRRLILLCTECHEVTHYGLAEVRGRSGAALAHLRAVTGLSAVDAQAHIAAAFAVWRERSTRSWRLDLAMLTDAGLTLTPPPAPDARARIAETELARLRADPDPSRWVPGRDDTDHGTDDVDDVDALNAFFAADTDPDDCGAEDCGAGGAGVSVRAISFDDAPAYLEHLLHGQHPPSPAPAPPPPSVRRRRERHER